MPRWIRWGGILVAALALIPPVLIARARTAKSPEPRIHPIQDMDNQPRYKAQQFTPLFLDRRAMRPPVEGTVARADWPIDEAFDRGRLDGEWVTGYPLEVDDALMEDGRTAYGIYCAPCHGLSGYGDGIVSKRAESLEEGTWVPPLSYHQDSVRARPNGELFQIVTNGIRTMPAYGVQIGERERWAIVLYLRALQRSQNASIEDVPADKRDELR